MATRTRYLLRAAPALLAFSAVGAAAGAANAEPDTAGMTDADLAEAVDLNRQWARLRFAPDPWEAPETDLLEVAHEDVVGDTKVGRCAAGGPLRLGKRTYSRGIGVNSLSVLRVRLSRPAARFVADIGLDRNVDATAASVRFRVKAEGQEVFATDVIRPDGAVRSLDLPLNGAREIELTVDDGGDGRGWDQGDWCDARFVLENGAELWVDELATRATPAAGMPFSFVYGGETSAALLRRSELVLQEEDADTGVKRRILTGVDPVTGLQVRVIASIYTDTPGVDWVLQFTNRGDTEGAVLERVLAVDTAVEAGIGAAPVLHRLRGSTCSADDWLPFAEQVAPGADIRFGAANGRSSADCPFFNLSWPGGGVVVGVGWSGQWRGSVQRDASGLIRLTAGMEDCRVRLRPGESIRSPRVMAVNWRGPDPIRGCNLFRRTMLKHVLPRVAGAPVPPPIAHLSTSFYELNHTDEQNVMSHLESVTGLGFEVFWLDAYWTRDGFPAGMGHYGFPLTRAEPADRFPNGVAAVGAAVAEAGLGFLMWFEPERVHPGTELAREHPEWVISPDGSGGGLFNLGIPAAREYMTRYLQSAIEAYGLDWLRIDYNIDPLPFWRFADRDHPGRSGMTEIRYVEGLYAMWDELRRTFPRLVIDNCASGGRRIDLETCSRSLPLWRSDNTCDMLDHRSGTVLHAAVKNQVMSAGLNRYVPFSTVGQMGAEPYLFRSGFNAGIAFCEDCREPDYPKALLQRAIAEGKRLRRYYAGDFYPLAKVTTSPRDWSVLQYHLPGAVEEGMVVAFRRHESPYASFAPHLRGIDRQARYAVTLAPDYTAAAPAAMSGAALMDLKLEIDRCPGSLVLEYKRLSR